MSTTKSQSGAPPAELLASEKPKRRLRMADAMRMEGVDECVVAKTYKSLLERTKENDTAQGAKLLLETARDCVEILEPADESDEIPANAIVQLIHNVPRPERDVTADGKDDGGAIGEEDGDFKFQN